MGFIYLFFWNYSSAFKPITGQQAHAICLYILTLNRLWWWLLMSVPLFFSQKLDLPVKCAAAADDFVVFAVNKRFFSPSPASIS